MFIHFVYTGDWCWLKAFYGFRFDPLLYGEAADDDLAGGEALDQATRRWIGTLL